MFTIHLIEGIIHIEDLPVKDFIESVRRINEMNITEKIDGANIIFGYDENGRFYTSREAKGGGRFYSEDDYPIRFWTTGFRSSHVALEKATKEFLNKIILPGDSFIAEILFGELPNTIPYKGIENQIILLKPFSSLTDKEKIQERFKKLVDNLKGKKIEVILDNVPYTEDGTKIGKKTEKYIWAFDVVPIIDISLVDKEFLQSRLEKKLTELENFLSSESTIKGLSILDVISIPLNKRPQNIDKDEWSILKEKIKEESKKIKEKILNMKLDIKEDLLNSFVRKVQSKFGPSLEEGGWIEGVVVTDPVSGRIFKLIDKDIFTQLNKFNWKIRSLLKDSNLSRKTGSYFVRVMKKISDVVGYSPNELKNKIKNNEKITFNKPEERIKEEIENILQKALNGLDRLLNFYKTNKDKIKVHVEKLDRTFVYDDTQHRKTLETFAELRQDLFSALKKIQEEKDINDVLTILFFGKEKITERKKLTEGGNIFPDTISIKREYIEPTLENLSKDLGIPFEMLKNNLLGSGLRKTVSGDIDIAMPENMYVDIKRKLKNLGYNHKDVKGIIHIQYPIAGRENEFVQIDFIFGDPEWLKIYFKSPVEEKYKGRDLNSLLGSIARFVDRKISDEMIDGEPLWEERWRWSPVDGLIQVRIETIVDKEKGKVLKKKIEKKLSQGIKDPDKVAKILLGPDAKGNDLSSIERILFLLKKNRKDIYNDVIENMKENYRKRKFEFTLPV